MKKLFIFIFLSTLFLIDATAQCSMCKAVATTSKGETGALALNNGILFLMATPYILGALVAVRWYIHNKQNKAAH